MGLYSLSLGKLNLIHLDILNETDKVYPGGFSRMVSIVYKAYLHLDSL